MIYAIIGVQVVLLALAVAFAVRLYRATPEKRSSMLRPTKRTVLIVCGVVLTGLVATGAVIFSLVGLTGLQAMNAADDYLREQYGPVSSWKVSLSEHVEQSKSPKAGFYRVHYRYGEKTGDLMAEYSERDGKLIFKFTPKNK
jgi:hypothetical protein